MKRPNILIVMTDHQRHDTVLSEGPVIAPNLQALAKDGLLFERAYCPSPHCCPSRATFFSGLYPSQHHVWNNICNGQRLSDGIHADVRLFSSDLKAAGYQMRYTGKWHVDTKTNPEDHGWDQVGVSADKNAVMGNSWDEIKEAAKTPDSTRRDYGCIQRPGYGDHVVFGLNENPESHSDVRSLKNACKAIDDFKQSDDPWCMYVGWNGPHDPYRVPQKYLDLYDLNKVQLPKSYGDMMRDKPVLYQRLRDQIFGQLSPLEVRDAMRHFYAYCSWLDDLFGQLLAKLDAANMTENTLILFTSDHGDYNGDHGLFAKGIPAFDGAYHVPFIVRWPQGITQPNRRESGFVSLADVAPTLLDVAGVTYEKQRFIGRSLVPFFKGGKPKDWREAMWHQCNGTEMYVTQRTIRTDKFRFTYNPFDRDELYDLELDPDECNNIAANPHYQDTCKELMTAYWKFALEVGDAATNAYITIGVAPVGPRAAFS